MTHRFILQAYTFFSCLIAASAIYASAASAQLGEVKLVSAGYEYYPSASSRRTELNPGGSNTAFQTFRASLAVPITLQKDRTLFIPSLRYSLLDIIPREGPRSPVSGLHALMLKAGLWHSFDEHWSVYVAVGGGLASDMEGDLSSDDLVFTAQLIGLWTIVPDFTLGAGVGYDRRTGSVSPLPLIALDWQPSDIFMLRGVVPESLALRFRTAQWLTLGIEGALEGERYHLGGREPGVDDAEVAYSLIKVGASATVHWTAWLHSKLYGGASLRRRFELYVDDESLGDLRVENGPYAGIELAIGPSGWRADER